DSDVRRKGSAWQAGRVPAIAAERWELLDDVVAGVEVKVPGLDRAVESDGLISTEGGDDGAIVANAVVEGETASGLPGVLKVDIGDAAGALGEEDVALVLVVGIAEEEVREAETRLSADLCGGHVRRGAGIVGKIGGRGSGEVDRSLTKDGGVVDLVPSAA